MIELPDFAVPGSRTVTLSPAGFTQAGVQSDDFIPRKGSRYAITQTYGPYTAEQARVMETRIVAAREQGGMRLPFLLLHSQGSPGAPVLDGAVTGGRVLALRGVTPGYFCKEGYWLSLVKDGQHFLHKVQTGGRADAAGLLEITLAELTRASFPDGATVNLAKPMIEGLMRAEEIEWSTGVEQVTAFEISIKEKQ